MGNNGRIGFDVFEMDIANVELRKQGKPVRLQPQPSKVLAALVLRSGQLVTRQELSSLLKKRCLSMPWLYI
jgi:DNA-binding winged helix-turn-helix (wHTH) protein